MIMKQENVKIMKKSGGGAYSLAGYIKGNLYAVYYDRPLYIFS